jgi:hypothetical protein
VGPGDRDETPPDGGVGDDLLPRLDRDPDPPRGGQLGMIRGHRGEGLRDGEPVRARLVRTWAGSWPQATTIPAASRAGV